MIWGIIVMSWENKFIHTSFKEERFKVDCVFVVKEWIKILWMVIVEPLLICLWNVK
jgi:hypothetical protein